MATATWLLNTQGIHHVTFNRLGFISLGKINRFTILTLCLFRLFYFLHVVAVLVRNDLSARKAFDWNNHPYIYLRKKESIFSARSSFSSCTTNPISFLRQWGQWTSYRSFSCIRMSSISIQIFIR